MHGQLKVHWVWISDVCRIVLLQAQDPNEYIEKSPSDPHSQHKGFSCEFGPFQLDENCQNAKNHHVKSHNILNRTFLLKFESHHLTYAHVQSWQCCDSRGDRHELVKGFACRVDFCLKLCSSRSSRNFVFLIIPRLQYGLICSRYSDDGE